jgi:MFS family permease
MTRDLTVMSTSLFLWGLGEGMFFYFQSLYLEEWGADPLQIGAILGVMGIAMTVAQAPAGWLGDRVGSRPVMWSSWILGTAAAGIMAMAGSLPAFVAGLLLYGLTSFVVAPMNSYITSVRGKMSVQRALTTVMAVYHFGSVLGPFLGGMIGNLFGLGSIFRFSAVIFVISTAVVLTARRPPVEAHVEIQARRPNLLRNPRFAGLLALILLTMFALYLAQPLSSNFLKNVHQLSVQQIGLLGSINSLGNAVLMLALGHLSAPVGFLLGQALVSIFALSLWQGNHMAVFAVGYFFFGGYRLARSMALAYARTLVKPEETGFAYGLVETGNAIASIMAPLAAGVLYSANPRYVYIASLILIAIMLITNLILLPRHSEDRQQDEHIAAKPAKTEP